MCICDEFGRGDPGKRWLAFLQNHREAILAFDFFTVPTVCALAGERRIEEAWRTREQIAARRYQAKAGAHIGRRTPKSR